MKASPNTLSPSFGETELKWSECLNQIDQRGYMKNSSSISLTSLKLPLPIILFFGLAPQSAHAACNKGEQLAFACTTTSNKNVEVCNAGDNATYSFGRAGAKPELFLLQPKKNLTFERNSGNGSGSDNGSASITFHVGQIAYQVNESSSRDDVSGGVEVRQGKKVLAQITCRESKIKANLFGGLDMEPWMTK